MLINKKDFSYVIVEFLNKKVAVKAEGWDKLALRGSSYIIAKRYDNIISDSSISSILNILGIVSSDGLIDMDYIKDILNNALGNDRTPPVFGYMFDKDDVQSLYDTAKNMYGGNNAQEL